MVVSKRSLRFMLIIVFSSHSFATEPSINTPGPQPIVFTSKPRQDGPWHALSIRVGSAGAMMAVYPGITRETFLLSADFYSSPEFNASVETTRKNFSSKYSPTRSTTAKVLHANYTRVFWLALQASGDVSVIKDTIGFEDATTPLSTYNFSPGFNSVNRGYRCKSTAADRYPLEAGRLALGCSGTQANATSNATCGLAGRIKDQGLIPSASFGLHIGSAAYPSITPSLYLGGYDRMRIVGPVSTQQLNEFVSLTPSIKLLDITMGVAEGESSFRFAERNKTGFLRSAARSGSNVVNQTSLTVLVDSAEPYLFLPKATCDAIAAELPVTYFPALRLYLWNTTDPVYDRIIQSPAYLGFVFEGNGSVTAPNITIKVPFRLLNLTLDQPLVREPTPYFPCKADDGNTKNGFIELPMLGRAFLQAAFIGVNFEAGDAKSGTWFLAQATGPRIGQNLGVVAITNETRSLQASDVSWEQSWEGYWSPIHATAEDTGQGDGDNSAGRPSTALVVGVSVTSFVVFVVGMTSAGLIWRQWRRRRVASGSASDGSTGENNGLTKIDESEVSSGLVEIDGVERPLEMHHGQEPRELAAPRRAVEVDARDE